ncbi:CD109 antigen [Amphiprion ocellaris]|uniref:CD109 molecule n=1 Tax=Amphiprion ocellaris TaxID=80972 RepID=A0A3Q1BRJ6_AMPOC|nr:CD109 antigen [Amphiprion ocellaris]
MKMERLQLWGLFGLVVLTVSQNTTDMPDRRPSYLVLSPRVLRSGVPMSVSVTVLIDGDVYVSARIVRGNQTLASNSSTVEGGMTKLLTFPPIYEDESGYKRSFTLEVEGHVGNVQVFSDATRLQFDLKGFSIFIQTDKLNYLPGQAVKIRVVSINPDGRPHISPMDVTIRNPRGYLIRQWLAADSVLGVISKEFDLSDNPPLGVWSITATGQGVFSSKTFHVAHYVLPKFEVMIQAPDVIYRKDPLEGFVTAKYLYGKPVQGHMNLTFIHHVHGIDEVYHEDREIDGTEGFEFDVPDYHPVNQSPHKFALYQFHVEHLTIVAHVTENLTGLTHNSSVKVSVAKSRYKLSFEEYPRILKPSLSFTAKLKISTYNGEPLSLEDQQKTAQVSVMQHEKIPWVWTMEATERTAADELHTGPSGMDSEEVKSEEMQLPIPPDGIIPLHIETNSETQVLSVDASFEDSEDTLMLYRKYTSSLQTYMQIHKPFGPAKVGSPLHLQIERNFPMIDLHYIVKSRGQVVSAGTGIHAANLTLVPEVSWAPLACIIVYCVHPTGEIVNDAIDVPITPVLQNKVSLSWSKTMTRPAEDVTLNISVAEPNSLVGILVVDKATRLAGSHNDITTETVLKEMKEFDVSLGYAHGDPYSVFKTCDLVVLTDAILYYHQLLPAMPVNGIFPTFVTSNLAVEHQEEQQEPHERQNFPETWIWMDANTGDSNTKEIPLTVPDSITSWTATAFVMSESLGLGFVDQPAKLTVFQDFFLSLNLPACIIRGEELVLEVILFNYLQQQLEVSVIVAQSDTFEFVFPDSEELPMPTVREVRVESESGTTVLIPIRPLIIGEIPISVKATSSAASDFVRTTVLVKAEGLEQLFSKSLLLELSPSESNISRNIVFTFPPDTVEDSQRVTVTAVGDILGPSISGLDSLIRMPYGCGEQNMINFAPNIYVLQYLNASGQADQNTVDRATEFMMKGYVRELSFQRLDGSFSAFGDRDSSGSTWLSAFVLRCFLQARPFISIDSQVLDTAAAWIAAQQAADGSFREPGRVIHTELQGGLDGPVSLTAYVLIALLEDSDIRAQYASEVSAALMYLEARLALGVSSSYSLSLLTYALALDGSSNAQTALSNLLGRAETIDGGLEWPSTHGGVSSSWQPRSADIEMVSYVLLTLHRLALVSQGLGLMKWLSQQRNDRGGFGSTQDTVVALQALATYAALGGSKDTDISIRVNINTVNTVASFHINQENYLLHQSQQIDPGNELNLQVTAEGHGLALFQLNIFYNIRNEELRRRRRHAGEREPFELYVSLTDEEMDSAQLNICYSLSRDLGLNMTGMAIMEVGLLSGFSLTPDAIQTDQVIKKVETQPGKVILYLDSVTESEMCLEIRLVLESRVAKVQGATVLLYDYYEPRRRTETTYKSWWRREMAACSFCGDGCSQCRADQQQEVSAAPSSRLHLLPAVLLLFVVFGM